MSAIRVLICGGIGFPDEKPVYAALDHIHTKRGISFLIVGARDGVTKYAMQWAKQRGVPGKAYDPDFKNHGPSAASGTTNACSTKACRSGSWCSPTRAGR